MSLPSRIFLVVQPNYEENSKIDSAWYSKRAAKARMDSLNRYLHYGRDFVIEVHDIEDADDWE